MKHKRFLKRFLCVALIISTLLLTCACVADEGVVESDTLGDSESVEETKANTGTNIVLSGEPSFRIVYSLVYKEEAQRVADKLISLDKNYVKGSNKYAVSQDTKTEADGTPEIIIGATNRDATNEVRNLINGKDNCYAIYVTDKAIAIFASSRAGIEAGVDALIKKISKKDGEVVYNNSKGNIVSEYTVESESEKPTEKPDAKPTDATTTPEKSDIDGSYLLDQLKQSASYPAYSIAVSTTEGIEVGVIRNDKAQNTYSISKVFCVTAIGMLYDEGKLKTTDTIGDIFKEEIEAYGIDKNKWKNVTVHDVLRHRAGFTEGGLLDIDAEPSLMNKHDDFLKVVLNYKISTYARDNDGNIASRKYTDAAYYLISRVVAKVSGEKLDVYLKSRLFDVADYKDYKITKCPQGHPIGATQFFLRPDDVVKLGRIYLDGGTYGNKRIISQEWVNMVIENGYEFSTNGTGYGKGGMNGQYLYINFKHNVAVAWLTEYDDGTSELGGVLRKILT